MCRGYSYMVSFSNPFSLTAAIRFFHRIFWVCGIIIISIRLCGSKPICVHYPQVPFSLLGLSDCSSIGSESDPLLKCDLGYLLLWSLYWRLFILLICMSLQIYNRQYLDRSWKYGGRLLYRLESKYHLYLQLTGELLYLYIGRNSLGRLSSSCILSILNISIFLDTGSENTHSPADTL